MENPTNEDLKTQCETQSERVAGAPWRTRRDAVPRDAATPRRRDATLCHAARCCAKLRCAALRRAWPLRATRTDESAS
eukprot:CAMPEP_0119374478 /NCGR_PEP_ID=MMETSP1334-20130426/30626_1 /TAXON_ID=127549 /ORGANISM="Calcidiscus leptoporus, Strain RCC1130" /LENGTH=77 /DNA_ID=CAMNT_0007392551 /DNA_START=387 /DNA_END=616 /DNA_ORIENTATION=+